VGEPGVDVHVELDVVALDTTIRSLCTTFPRISAIASCLSSCDLADLSFTVVGFRGLITGVGTAGVSGFVELLSSISETGASSPLRSAIGGRYPFVDMLKAVRKA